MRSSLSPKVTVFSRPLCPTSLSTSRETSWGGVRSLLLASWAWYVDAELPCSLRCMAPLGLIYPLS